MSKIPEPLLTENPNRYVMFPISDNEIWSHYKKMMDCFWRAEEIDLSKDLKHWKTLNKDEQHFIKHTCVFCWSRWYSIRKLRTTIFERNITT